MENWKKILLIFVIFIFIIALDLFLYFKTDKLINSTQDYLSKLQEKLDEKNVSESQKLAKELNDKWDKYENVLSFFIEHDEIEKVSSKVAIIKENTRNEEYEIALEDVIETKYLLNHIKDKYNLTFKNIF